MKLQKVPNGATVRIWTYRGLDNILGKVVDNRKDGTLVGIEYPVGSNQINHFVADCDVVIEEL